jgi:ankyrin repeat protein
MAAIKDRDELTKALVEAAFICDFVRVRELLHRGADVNGRDQDQRTPLFSAVLGGSVGLVGLLLESGADVNARDGEGWTALHFAAQEHETEIARILIARGADVNAQDEDGASVLWRAVFSARGNDEIVRDLLLHGAKEDLANKAGESPRQLAERLGTSILDPVN